MFARVLALLAAFALAPAVRADDVKDAETKLKDHLSGIKGADAARVSVLTADGVKETFPDHVLFAVVFPQYPVARLAPEPLKSANVFAVPKKKDGKPVLVTDLKELEKFFKEHARAVVKVEEIEGAVSAWLRAAAELHQDGFFTFTVKLGEGRGVNDNATMSGEVTVDPKNGDKGGLKATLKFKAGKLTSAETKVDLKAGMRPRCQATKLLDPDPIVRLMAEDSLRVMGSSAKHYLNDQYAKASPELREAIDRVRAKSLAEGR